MLVDFKALSSDDPHYEMLKSILEKYKEGGVAPGTLGELFSVVLRVVNNPPEVGRIAEIPTHYRVNKDGSVTRVGKGSTWCDVSDADVSPDVMLVPEVVELE